MQEREVTVLWEKEQRKVETQKAPPGRMKVGGGRMLLTWTLQRTSVRSWLGSAVLPPARDSLSHPLLVLAQ